MCCLCYRTNWHRQIWKEATWSADVTTGQSRSRYTVSIMSAAETYRSALDRRMESVLSLVHFTWTKLSESRVLNTRKPLETSASARLESGNYATYSSLCPQPISTKQVNVTCAGLCAWPANVWSNCVELFMSVQFSSRAVNKSSDAQHHTSLFVQLRIIADRWRKLHYVRDLSFRFLSRGSCH